MFESLVVLESLTNNKSKTISKIEYSEFCNEFVFDKLRGKSFEESFCERFNFNRTFFKGLSDEVAKDHIEKLGYIK